MLKPLLLASTATIFQLVLVSTNTLGITPTATANTFTASHQQEAVSSTRSLSTLISKGDKSGHINAQQESDVRGIHKTLTQAYRGFNEYDLDRIERSSLQIPERDKDSLRKLFSQLRAAKARVSFEVKNIELMSLSERNAVVNIDAKTTTKVPTGTYVTTHSYSLTLVKQGSKWKLSDAGAAVSSVK